MSYVGQPQTLFAQAYSTAQTASFTTGSFPLGNATDLFVAAAADTVTGTTPTLAVQLQEQTPLGDWINVGSPTPNLTAAGNQSVHLPSASLTHYGPCRLVVTISGTTPSYTGLRIVALGRNRSA